MVAPVSAMTSGTKSAISAKIRRETLPSSAARFSGFIAAQAGCAAFAAAAAASTSATDASGASATTCSVAGLMIS